MEKPTALLILNPVSGLTDAAQVQVRFEAFFQEAGWQTDIYLTTPASQTKAAVQQAVRAGVALVVAAGGDGTLSEVADGLVGSGVPLGIVPCGTWNALSRNLGIPLVLDEALRLLVVPHRLIPMDALAIRGRHYILNVGIGLSASVIQHTRREQKRRFGFLAYFANFFAQASGLRQKVYRLTVDGREHKVRATELMVINSSILGMGELKTSFEINPSDGKVEILAARSPNLFGLMWIAARYLIGHQKRGPGLITFSATRSISIRTRWSSTVQADGDIIGRTPVEIQIVPSAVQIIVP